jgi:citrate lyase subunit beta/citryl-CoA lyase
MVETCAAVLALPGLSLCAAETGLGALVVGANDLAREMGARPDPERTSLQAALSLTVCAARAAGITALDGVFNRIEDVDGLERECAQGRAFGFDGKTLIHPSQIDVARAAFSPDEAEIAWARAVVEAFARPEAEGAGAIRMGEEMVERLHLSQARRVLASAGRG